MHVTESLRGQMGWGQGCETAHRAPNKGIAVDPRASETTGGISVYNAQKVGTNWQQGDLS